MEINKNKKSVGFGYQTSGIATSPLTTTANRAGSYLCDLNRYNSYFSISAVLAISYYLTLTLPVIHGCIRRVWEGIGVTAAATIKS